MTILDKEIVQLLMAVDEPSAKSMAPLDIGKLLVDSLLRAELCKLCADR